MKPKVDPPGSATPDKEHSRVEASSRASDEQFRALFEGVPIGIGIADRTGKLLAFNRAMLEYGGYDRDDVQKIGHVSALYHDPRQREEVLAIFANQGAVKNHPVQFKRKDGSVFDALLSLTPTTFDGQACIQALVEDITERKRTEQTLARIMAAVGSSSDAIGISDAEGHHVYQNKALSDLFGYATAEELEAAGGGAARVKDPAVARQMFDNIMNGRSSIGELEMVTRSGRVFPAFERADAVVDDSGQVVGLIGVITDITERKRAEEEKARLEAQLQQAQKMESVGRLAGGVAHDFNNMLGVIIGHAEMALEQVDPSLPLYADLTTIRASANRSAELTRQLLAFARKQTVAPRVLDLNEIVTGTLKMLQRLIGEQITVDWRPRTALWPVKVDSSQIEQILANLCLNAMDAMSGIGAITIETENVTITQTERSDSAGVALGEYVRLVVSDSGRGMDEITLAHIFEPFFTTKGVGEGTGLGLATVYGAVQQNHGAIRVQSTPGLGTTFTIYLPRHGGGTDQAPAGFVASRAEGGRETVLVVEDEPALLHIIKTSLERRGYTVLAASAPEAAMELADKHAGGIHLLVTDVVMPQMDGRALAQNVLSLCPNVKRLFMSGYTSDIIARHGVLDEGLSFIQKPFTADALAAKVREILDSESSTVA